MIRAIGVDVVHISRIKRAMKNPRFVSRILTKTESELGLTPQFVAGRWAAKEAIAKAVGTHLRWQDVEILKGEDGRPRVTISSEKFDARKYKIHISISHEREIAIGMAVLEVF